MNPRVRIILEDGRKINLKLFPEYAPISVNNFLDHVNNKMYDGVVFHRVIENFMIQTGAYYLENNYELNIREGLRNIKGEFTQNGVNNPLKHTLGVVSMARTNNPDSASNQFFICSTDTPHLDGAYAAFGICEDEESIKVVLEISKVETYMPHYSLQNFPVEPIIIKTVEIL